jgi:PAS domain-containing protein
MPDDTFMAAQRSLRQNPRVHLLDDVWLLTIVTIVAAVSIPWFVNGLDVQVGIASWGLFALGAIHVALTLLASPASADGPWRTRALMALDVIGVAVVGFIWAHVGALQNPLFLAAFILPVVGAIFVSRWHPFLIAAVSILIVGVVAASREPELRAYLGGWPGADSPLIGVFGHLGSEEQSTFAGFYAPTRYLLVLLEVFAVVVLGCAAAAEYLGTIFERLLSASGVARIESERSELLWATLIERLPLPALLVDADSLLIVKCSAPAAAYLRLEQPPEGRAIFDVVRFSFADLVQELIVGASGESSSTTLRIAGETRLAQLRVLHVVHKKRRLALLTIEDTTEAFCLRAAWDTSEQAALLVDASGKILAFNKPAATLFEGLEPGAEADRFLSQRVAGLAWWDPGLAKRRKMHIEIDSRIYEVTSSEIGLPGEGGRLSSVSLLPVARAESPGARAPAEAAPAARRLTT